MLWEKHLNIGEKNPNIGGQTNHNIGKRIPILGPEFPVLGKRTFPILGKSIQGPRGTGLAGTGPRGTGAGGRGSGLLADRTGIPRNLTQNYAFFPSIFVCFCLNSVILFFNIWKFVPQYCDFLHNIVILFPVLGYYCFTILRFFLSILGFVFPILGRFFPARLSPMGICQFSFKEIT